MADIKAIDIPKWGLSMEEGLVNAWLIEEGDSFTKGQLICEIETSKITNELEAPFDGLTGRAAIDILEHAARRLDGAPRTVFLTAQDLHTGVRRLITRVVRVQDGLAQDEPS